jgi:hypothetical protein
MMGPHPPPGRCCRVAPICMHVFVCVSPCVRASVRAYVMSMSMSLSM